MNGITENYVNVIINGKSISAPDTLSVVQALWFSGSPRVKSIGCLDGVCGSCRIIVQRAESREITMELGCRVMLEEGLDVSFLPFPESVPKKYQLNKSIDESDVKSLFKQIFPEAAACRHCGGCNIACPKEIDVESGVILGVKGEFQVAGDLFYECVLCDLCETACPEAISPAQIGTFSRRVSVILNDLPSNLADRLTQIASKQLSVVIDK